MRSGAVLLLAALAASRCPIKYEGSESSGLSLRLPG